MTYNTVTALWEGTTGLPGYTRMKWNGLLDSADLTLAANKMHTFFAAIESLIPSDVSISWDGLGQQYDDQRQLTGEIQYTPPSAITGTSSSTYASPVGLVIDWLTSDFAHGRRVRGRSFIVPTGSNAFFTDGTPTSTALSTLSAAGAALIVADPLLVINAGPVNARANYVVTGVSVPDRAAVLRSRRD